MKFPKKLKCILFLLLVLSAFLTCSSAKKLQKEAPKTIGKAYYQNWVAGVHGGGSGTNVFIETKNKNSNLDSIYFHGKVAKLAKKPMNKKLFIGYFKSEANVQEFKVKDSKSKAVVAEDFPFDLKKNECVVSYIDNGKTKYFKIENLE